MNKLLVAGMMFALISGCASLNQSSPYRTINEDSRTGRNITTPRPHPVTVDEYRDPRTGLIWQRCVLGIQWTGQTCEGWPRGVKHISAIAYASFWAKETGRAWRLPRVNELRELYDSTHGDRSIFPLPGPMSYWSIDKATGWHSYYVKFYVPDDGKTVDYDYDNRPYGVLLVRSY